MRRILLFLTFSVAIFVVSGLSGFIAGNPGSQYVRNNRQDTIDNQVLYNGRLWRNLFVRVKGDQFLFSDIFLPGTVSIDKKTFKKVTLKYDIYHDEIIALSDQGFIVQLNKEIIDAFSLFYQNRIFNFRKMGSDTLETPDGYVNILVDGALSLYVKYKKNILNLAVDNKYDLFNQVHRIYIRKDEETYLVSSRKELLNILSDHEQEIKSFIKNKKLKVSRNMPDSFIPVVEYYNELQKK